MFLGNVDLGEWHGAPRFNFLHDADRVMEAFYELCHAVGPKRCAFYAETPKAIEQRLDALLEEIRRHPVIIPDSPSGPDLPELVTWSKVKMLVNTALYQPVLIFETFAKVLKALEEGDGMPYWNFTTGGKPPTPICEVEVVPSDVPLVEEGTEDAGNAISCADKWGSHRGSLEDFEDYARHLGEASSATGDVNALWMLSCLGRIVEPKFRYGGEYHADKLLLASRLC